MDVVFFYEQSITPRLEGVAMAQKKSKRKKAQHPSFEAKLMIALLFVLTSDGPVYQGKIIKVSGASQKSVPKAALENIFQAAANGWRGVWRDFMAFGGKSARFQKVFEEVVSLGNDFQLSQPGDIITLSGRCPLAKRTFQSLKIKRKHEVGFLSVCYKTKQAIL